MKKSTLFLMLFAVLMMANCGGTEGTNNDNNSNPTTDGDTDVTNDGDDDSEIGITETDAVEAKSGETHIEKYGVTFVEIPGGSFIMGDDDLLTASPRHLEIVPPFLMGQTVVTKEQYVAFLNERGNNLCEGYECAILEDTYKPNHIIITDIEVSVEAGFENKPAQQITWYGAKAFCEVVGGRLPEEAEWEYSARAGITTDYLCGDGVLVEYDGEYDQVAPECMEEVAYVDGGADDPFDVFTRSPNAFGLYNTVISVYEWTNTIYTRGFGGPSCEGYVSKGTPWDDSYFLSYASRGNSEPDKTTPFYGFRCAKDF